MRFRWTLKTSEILERLISFCKVLCFVVIYSKWNIPVQTYIAQNMKFSIKDFLSKCDQIRSNLRIWSHLLKKSLMENFMYCTVYWGSYGEKHSRMNQVKFVEVSLISTIYHRTAGLLADLFIQHRSVFSQTNI